jgi:hypothetical protein
MVKSINIRILKSAQAEREFQRKIKLERTFMPHIRSVFNAMVNDYKSQVAQIGLIPQASDFSDEWRAVLKQQYRRVGRVFLNNQRNSKFYDILLETKQDLSAAEEAALMAAFIEWSRLYGIDQESYITQTNQKDYREAYEEATETAEMQAMQGGAPLSTAAIAALAAIALRKRFNRRVAGIANMNTQAPAEKAKLDEAVAINNASGRLSEVKKEWITVQDETVRPWHKEAHGQQVLEQEAFIVGGQNLMYPGDASMGATIENLINCRCFLDYS